MRASRGRVLAPGATRRPVGEAPAEKIVTEAELRVKQLLEAQLDSSVTLSSLQARYKQFTPSLRYEPRLSAVSGTTSLASYSSMADGDQRLDDLRQLGLAEDDIRFKLASESADEQSVQRRCLVNPVVALERLERIDEQLQAKGRDLLSGGSGGAPAAFSGAAAVSRHTMQLERAIGSGKRLASVAGCLLRERHPEPRPHRGDDGSADDDSRSPGRRTRGGGFEDDGRQWQTRPEDLLLEIAAELESGGCRKRLRIRSDGSRRDGGTARDERWRPADRPACDGGVGPCYDAGGVVRAEVAKLPSLEAPFDLEQQPSTEGKLEAAAAAVEAPSLSAAGAVSFGDDGGHRRMSAAAAVAAEGGAHGSGSPDEERPSVVDDGPTPVCGPVALVTDEHIAQNRLSADELRALPRFSAYVAGEPSNVLYLKNLASSVRELDLVALFQRFSSPCKPRLIYRLLAGRMKGQAFVTFPDVGTATSALCTLNGFVFRGKPVVISYGRRSSSEVASGGRQPVSRFAPAEQVSVRLRPDSGATEADDGPTA